MRKLQPVPEQEGLADTVQPSLWSEDELGASSPETAQELLPNEMAIPAEKETLSHEVAQRYRDLSEQVLAARQRITLLLNTDDPSGGSLEQVIGLQNRVMRLEEERIEICAAFPELLKEDKPSSRRKRSAQTRPDQSRGLMPLKHPTRDFFLADLLDYTLKDDAASMEAPLFTLSTKPDLSIWEWRSKDGSKYIKVAPSVLGRATIHDKDVLIYVISQLVEGLNQGRHDARNRTVRFTVYDFMVATNRSTGGRGYQLIHSAFERLRGTSITTDIKTAGQRIRDGFGIIDSWHIVEKSPDDERMVAVEVTLSSWLYNAVRAYEVLSIHPDYFRLRKPLAKRLYELARKHCGHQSSWRIGLDSLYRKSGSRTSMKEFRRSIREIEEDGYLPQYWMHLNSDDIVTFTSSQADTQTTHSGNE